jgi:hypothetical protein
VKLAGIYNVWDGVELLKGSIDQLELDLIIIIWQDVSNFGERFDPMERMKSDGIDKLTNVIFQKYIPQGHAGLNNEINKRQLGLKIAKENTCTHFLHLDCDEYYDKEEFKDAKNYILNNGINGSVCKIYTYFKHPTFRLETPDGYYVPFIHRLKHDTKINKTYPFYADPSRRINEPNVQETSIFMHHFSWVREDIERKARNSTARNNIRRGSLLKEYYSNSLWTNPEGYYIKDFDKRLILVENKFNVQIKNT